MFFAPVGRWRRQYISSDESFTGFAHQSVLFFNPLFILLILVAGIVSGVANSGSYDITRYGMNKLASHWNFGVGLQRLHSDSERCVFFFPFLLQDLSCLFSSWAIQSSLVPIVVLSLVELLFLFNFIGFPPNRVGIHKRKEKKKGRKREKEGNSSEIKPHLHKLN